MSGNFEIVPFNNNEILTVRQHDGVFVVMKPIVEALHLKWHTQRERITKHPVISKGIRFIRIPSAGGMQEMLCLHLEQFHGWLVTLETRRIAEEAQRTMIELYQAGAFRTIFEHHHGKMDAPRITAKGAAAQIALNNHYLALGNKLLLTKDRAARQMIYDLMQGVGEQIGQVPPPLNDLGADEPENFIADSFFAALLELQNRGEEFSMSRNPALLAVSLPSLRPLMVAHGIECPPDRLLWPALKRHPAYEFHGNVNCEDEKIRRCWAFRRDDLLGFEPYATTSNPGA
ncbi:phage antirepressor N-terminal domain-containing protein [Sphingobium yanoikuyae]|uniref:phage antirepressor N-terminal domain-containing protein n=1 Tax=Sphingobium yanoikuyae TaxID=13690 RepID=UPI002FDCDF1F